MNTAHAIASAKARKFASLHRNSGGNSASAARSLIMVSIGNLASSCVSVLPDNLRGADFARPPPNEKACWLQAATAATVLWIVELRTSYVCTRGVPSTTDARIFVTSGYVPRLYASACSAVSHRLKA